MLRKKRYWALDCKTGKDYICDAWNKQELAQKLGVKKSLIRIERFRFISDTSGKTIYDIPFEGY